jgi:hypothetical protein
VWRKKEKEEEVKSEFLIGFEKMKRKGEELIRL